MENFPEDRYGQPENAGHCFVTPVLSVLYGLFVACNRAPDRIFMGLSGPPGSPINFIPTPPRVCGVRDRGAAGLMQRAFVQRLRPTGVARAPTSDRSSICVADTAMLCAAVRLVPFYAVACGLVLSGEMACSSVSMISLFSMVTDLLGPLGFEPATNLIDIGAGARAGLIEFSDCLFDRCKKVFIDLHRFKTTREK